MKIESELRSAINSLPVCLRTTFETPIVAWYYPETLGQKLFNYNRFIANKSVDELVQLAKGECECHKNPDFMNPEHGHIATCHVKVIGHTQLQALVSMGTKHRWWSKKWEDEGYINP